MKRIQNLVAAFGSFGIDGLLVSSVANITYLTGFTGDASRLVVSEKGVLFLTDGRYTEQAAKECHPEIEILKWINDNRYGAETYRYACERLGIQQLGFEEDVVTFSEYGTIRSGIEPETVLVPVQGAVNALRMVKENREISLLREACAISDLALQRTLPFIKPGITELELTARLEYELKMAGSAGLSFDTIVLAGNRTSLLHGQPGNTRLKQGDLLLFDFGAMAGGYHADMSRTFILGKASRAQKDLYNHIRTAQESAVSSIKSGAQGNHPDSVVRGILGDTYLPYYYPGLGHGVGLEIHELPFIKNNSEFVFRKNMTVTIEPGCYLPGWGGIRIEDTIVVTDGDPEILTRFPKELTEL
ncbi:MAG: aminopeptidase P family protein [Bacteroidales bacterium]|nr:aminopeptidase P family protein [Bacteroidales bacterium]